MLFFESSSKDAINIDESIRVRALSRMFLCRSSGLTPRLLSMLRVLFAALPCVRCGALLCGLHRSHVPSPRSLDFAPIPC